MEVLRRLKLVKPSNKEVEARQKQLKTLFSYRKGPVQGFPPNGSCFAFDATLGFLVLCTDTGSINVYGKLGVQFHGQLASKAKVEKVFFLREQARFVTLAADWSMHKWEMNTSTDGTPSITSVGSLVHPSGDSLKKWVVCLGDDEKVMYCCDHLDNVIKVDLAEMKVVEGAEVKKEELAKIASEEQKSKMATINILLTHPAHPNKLLVGHEEGMMVLWSEETGRSERCFGTSQSLQDASFSRDGMSLVTAHSDGSHMTWNMGDVMKNVDNAVTYPYGPFPCRDIGKIVSKTSSKMHSPLLVFSGGLPRATFPQKNSVTLTNGSKHVVLDLPSKCIDFIVISEADEKIGGDLKAPDNPQSLLILTADELLMIDLTSPDWPLAHVTCCHHSDVTAMQSVADVSQNVWIKLDFLRRKYQSDARVVFNYWPMKGGQTTMTDKEQPHLLITGHQNGDVVFWRLSLGVMRKMFVWSSADVFQLTTTSSSSSSSSPLKSPCQSQDDNWPPFRETTYKSDKDVDDDRLGINQLSFDAHTGVLVAGGASGQVLVAGIEGHETPTLPTEVSTIALMEGSAAVGGSVDGGEGHLRLSQAYRGLLGVAHVLQVDALFPCTSLSFKPQLQLLAIGTTNGFCLYDLRKAKVVLIRRTVSAAARGMNRSKSFQQSVRESFRGAWAGRQGCTAFRLKRKSIPSSPAHKAKEIEIVANDDAITEEDGKKEEVDEKVKENGVEVEVEKKGEGEKMEGDGEKVEKEEEGHAKTVTSELKEHKIEQMDGTKKVEIVTSVLKTSAVVTTKTTTKKEAAQEATAAATTTESPVAETKTSTPTATTPATATSPGDKSACEREKEVDAMMNGGGAEKGDKGGDRKGGEMAKACTLRRGVNFDTPTKAPASSTGDTSVTCVRLSSAQLTHASSSCQTSLWVGLNDGSVYGYQVVVPCEADRAEEDVSAVLAKEIHLKHGAAVCELLVVDEKGVEVVPEPESSSAAPKSPDGKKPEGEGKKEGEAVVVVVEDEKREEMKEVIKEVEEKKGEKKVEGEGEKEEAKKEEKEAEKKEEVKKADKQKETDKGKETEKGKVVTQRLLVCSKEQIKVFSLPGLKALTKHKVYRGRDEGHICNAFVTSFHSSEDTSYSEASLVCLTSTPEVTTLHLPSLKTQVKVTALNQPPSPFYAHLASGQLLYLASPRQLASFSLSTLHRAAPAVALTLKDGMRVKVVVEEKEEGDVDGKGGKAEGVVEEAQVLVNGGGDHVEGEEADKQTPEEASKQAPTASTKEDEEEDKQKAAAGQGAKTPKEIIVDVKKYSTTTSTTTTIQNEDLLEDSVKDHFLDEGETTMVITSHDVMENKMVIKTTTHTITDCHGDQSQTTTVSKETTSTTQEGNYQEGMPAPMMPEAAAAAEVVVGVAEKTKVVVE